MCLFPKDMVYGSLQMTADSSRIHTNLYAYSVTSSSGQVTELMSSSHDCSSPLASGLTFRSGLVWRVPIFSVVLRTKLETLEVKYQQTNKKKKKTSLLPRMKISVPKFSIFLLVPEGSLDLLKMKDPIATS